MKKFGFGELELAILQTVRNLGTATVREVYRALGSKGGYTTVMTVMSRMADKGDLTREKEGNKYWYRAAPVSQGPSKNLLKRIREKVFGGRSTALLCSLIESDEEISDGELAEMEELIRKRRSEKKRG